MDVSFEGQVAVVTGAGQGLGRAYARELARRGAAVVVNDLGGDVHGRGADAGLAAQVAAEIGEAGGRAVANGDSVATPEGAAAIVQAALDAFGRLDAVVTNAGILRNDNVVDVDPADLDTVLGVHLKGTFFVLQHAMRVMQAAGYGRAVLVSSGVAAFGNTGQAAYAAAKGGIIGLARAAALEGAPHGILVNTIMPLARTRMADAMEGKGRRLASQESDRFLAAIPQEAVVPLVAFLASRDCPVTGTAFSAGGGRFARVFTGLGEGWLAPDAATVTAEDVATHFEEIAQTERFSVPDSLTTEARQLMERLAAR